MLADTRIAPGQYVKPLKLQQLLYIFSRKYMDMASSDIDLGLFNGDMGMPGLDNVSDEEATRLSYTGSYHIEKLYSIT